MEINHPFGSFEAAAGHSLGRMSLLNADVPVSAEINIHKHLKNGELFLTEGLGHRKILAYPEVIEKVVRFINQT